MVKVPLTPHNLLLDTLPKVHKSGQSSPSSKEKVASDKPPDTIPSEDKLQEKLLLASVSAAVILKPEDPSTTQEVTDSNEDNPLFDPTQFRGYPRMIRGNDYMSLSGSDCELSLILLVCILVFCIIIPLIYVFFVYEHPEDFHHPHSKYDDDLRYLHHLSDNHNSTTTKL